MSMVTKGLCNLSKPIYDIVQLVANEYGLDIDDIKSTSKARQLVWPRHLAMYMCYQAGHSTGHIGKFLNRCRSTVSYAAITVTDICSAYPKLNKERIRIAKLLDILE